MKKESIMFEKSMHGYSDFSVQLPPSDDKTRFLLWKASNVVLVGPSASSHSSAHVTQTWPVGVLHLTPPWPQSLRKQHVIPAG